ncbi:MAG: hypothetical protein J3Q66DRAFT_390098 [Benniella sp.]|nr:MAG: hypothetical protein J3Q66DRAFT_390098 [Benniella sp.]
MGLSFLRALRICLVLLAFITFIIAAHTLRIFRISVSIEGAWITWLPLSLAVFSGISYTWALRAQATQRNIMKSNAARYAGSFFLCIVWLVSPIYNRIIINVFAFYNPTGNFLDCERPECNLGFARDLCGFIMAFLVFLEVIFAYRYERSSKDPKTDTGATNIIVGPALVQPAHQHTHYAPMQQPVQQYVYGPAEQPSQPLMYYPQPVPQQTPNMSYQAQTTWYQIPQQTPTHQLHPPPTH